MFDTNTVIITTEEYEKLIRASERMDILARCLSGIMYLTDKDIRSILGLEKDEKEESTNEAV